MSSGIYILCRIH